VPQIEIEILKRGGGGEGLFSVQVELEGEIWYQAVWLQSFYKL